jgi:hypothetical protein
MAENDRGDVVLGNYSTPVAIGFIEKQVAEPGDGDAVLMARAGIEVGAVSTAGDQENPAWLSHQIGDPVVTVKVEPVVDFGDQHRPVLHRHR